MDNKCWLLMLTMLCTSNTAMGADTAQKTDRYYFEEDKAAARFLSRLPLAPHDVGVYYVPPPDADKRGFIFDDIPRETISTQAQLTEHRMKKEGKFVKFNHRHISYSLAEMRDDSVRFNLYPTKKAVMLNWTHAIPVLASH